MNDAALPLPVTPAKAGVQRLRHVSLTGACGRVPGASMDSGFRRNDDQRISFPLRTE